MGAPPEHAVGRTPLPTRTVGRFPPPAQVAPAAEKEGGAPPAAEAVDVADAVAAETMGERGAVELADAE